MSAAWLAYRTAAPLLGAIAALARPFVPERERPHWGERLGRVALEGGCDAWIHAASLGEATAVPPLARELARHWPESRLLLTATTATGRARLEGLGREVALAPIDSPQAVRAFFEGAKPRRLLLIETELWPHWLLRARAEDVPVAVVSARLSERSVGRYRRLGSGMRELVRGLRAVLCQSEVDRARWRAVGAREETLAVVGNLKNDSLPRPLADRGAARADLGLDPARPLLVLGSLRPGEPGILARSWASLPAALRESWQVVAVPRHPYAGPELRQEVALAEEESGSRSAAAGAGWKWDDRTGVLAAYYAAADAAFVGGSLKPYGGHNPLEPAASGAAVIVGPHTASQAEAIRALTARDAAWRVDGETSLRAALLETLEEPRLRARRAAAALEVVEGARGAAGRAVEHLCASGLWPKR